MGSPGLFTGHWGLLAKVQKHSPKINPLCPSWGVPSPPCRLSLPRLFVWHRAAKVKMNTGLYILTEQKFPQNITEENYPYYNAFVYRWKKSVGPPYFYWGEQDMFLRRASENTVSFCAPVTFSNLFNQKVR